MPRVFTRVALLCLAAVAMSACYEAEITLNADHGGTFKVTQTLPPTKAFANDAEKATYEGDQKGNFAAEGVEVTKVSAEDTEKARLVRAEGTVADFAKSHPFKNTTFIFEEKDGKTLFTATLFKDKNRPSAKPAGGDAKPASGDKAAAKPAPENAPKTKSEVTLNGQNPMEILKERTIKVTIHFPAAVSETNGVKGEDGKTVTWNTNLFDLQGGDQTFTATYAGVAK